MWIGRHVASSFFVLLTATLPAGCGDTVTEPDEATLWVIEVSGEEFRVRVSAASARTGLEARLESGAEGVIIGSIVRGDGGFNAPWSWHLDPATVEAIDAAIELCDGRPSMVEADLDYWVDTVRSFCPWGARVVRRE